MKTLADIRSKVEIARRLGNFVVLTVEEADVLFAAIDVKAAPAPSEGSPLRGPAWDEQMR